MGTSESKETNWIMKAYPFDATNVTSMDTWKSIVNSLLKTPLKGLESAQSTLKGNTISKGFLRT